MRKIEQEMNRAIREHRDWGSGNTCVEFAEHVGNPYLAATVYLHGNPIADVLPDGTIEPNCDIFRMYPTVTTRSRLRALGVDARAYIPRNGGQRIAYIDGEALS